jgi:hypothetical protein
MLRNPLFPPALRPRWLLSLLRLLLSLLLLFFSKEEGGSVSERWLRVMERGDCNSRSTFLILWVGVHNEREREREGE